MAMCVDTYMDKGFFMFGNIKSDRWKDAYVRNLNFDMCCADVEPRKEVNPNMTMESQISLAFRDFDVRDMLGMKNAKVIHDQHMLSHGYGSTLRGKNVIKWK